MLLKKLKFFFNLILCSFSCIIEPPEYLKLSKPQLTFNELSFVKDKGEYIAAIHLHWEINNIDREHIAFFVLLRKYSGDSIFDVFAGSRGIPADTFNFYDKLSEFRFPENGYDSICYRIFSINKYGNSGDTSDVCIVYIAPQPELKEYNKEKGCIKWESWIRGGISSWCEIWEEEKNIKIKSGKIEAFPFTDEPARFQFCLPDSLKTMFYGKWFYSIFVSSNNRYSVKVGAFDVH